MLWENIAQLIKKRPDCTAVDVTFKRSITLSSVRSIRPHTTAYLSIASPCGTAERSQLENKESGRLRKLVDLPSFPSLTGCVKSTGIAGGGMRSGPLLPG